jgi:V/A-type H+-transporting ATPase subunit E
LSSKKAFDNVVGKVINNSKSEILLNLEQTYSDVSLIFENAESETDIKSNEILQSIDRQGDILQRRIIGNAELKARNMSLQLIEDTINKIFEKSMEKLETVSSDKGYDISMKKLLEEGIDAIGGDNFIISCNSKDTDLLKKIINKVEKEKKVNLKLSLNNISCMGGVQIMNNSKSVIFNNTVEARLSRFKPLLRKQISDMFTK